MNVKNKISKLKIPTATKTKMFHIKEIHILKCEWRKLTMFILYIYNISVGKTQGKKSLGRLRYVREDNTCK